MYVMAVLCIVKLYQNRHPDINATAYVTFTVVAAAILIGKAYCVYFNLIILSSFTIVYSYGWNSRWNISSMGLIYKFLHDLLLLFNIFYLLFTSS